MNSTPLSLSEWLVVGEPAALVMVSAARLLLAPLTVVVVAMATLGSTIFGSVHAMLIAVVRMLAVLLVLEHYSWLVGELVGSSDALLHWIYAQTSWSEQLSGWWDELRGLSEQYEAGEVGLFDFAMGTLQGQMLSMAVLTTGLAASLILIFVQCATVVFLNLAYILGPLMLVVGALGGSTTQSFFLSLIEISLWPVVPTVTVMGVMRMGETLMLPAGNVAVIIVLNLLLVLLSVLSPVVVHLLLHRSGVAALGVTATMLGARALFRLSPSGAELGMGGRSAPPGAAMSSGSPGRGPGSQGSPVSSGSVYYNPPQASPQLGGVSRPLFSPRSPAVLPQVRRWSRGGEPDDILDAEGRPL